MQQSFDKVLSGEECDALIAEASKQLVEMTVLGDNTPGYRIAQGTWITEPNEVVQKLRLQIAGATCLPVENQEALHIVHYDVGGEYKPHEDGFYPGEDYYEQAVSRGGQRSHSCMVWLNDGFRGGETHFPLLGKFFTPIKGNMLVWSNLDDGNRPDIYSKHAGLPVQEGEKWIAIVWVRERRFA